MYDLCTGICGASLDVVIVAQGKCADIASCLSNAVVFDRFVVVAIIERVFFVLEQQFHAFFILYNLQFNQYEKSQVQCRFT